ncbi:MAG: phenylacetate--CoA ligase family protein [Candidatus Omnitrophica bacterium]|nr:phenylacetate--CoA ligase family protein [Candidatus Omnitrophota bacterium]
MFNTQALKKVSQLARVKLRSWDDFRKIPIATREDIKAFAARGLGDDAFNVTATSGSTSSRLVIVHSRQAYDAHLKRLTKIYRQVGAKPGVLCLNLCSYELNSGGRLMEAAYKAAGCGVIPLGPISTPEKVTEAVRLIIALKPTMVNAYTNQLYDLFSALGCKHPIRRCVVNGELLWPEYRKRIEQLGNVDVHDHYGAMEVSGFAIALRSNDEWMKVTPDGLLLEVLQENKTAAATGTGDLLVTDLNNTCLPFIRYRLGDRVELVRRKGALWVKVLGRTEDSILVNGVVIMKQDLVRAAGDFLRHPRFFFIITKDPVKYYDRIIINVAGSLKETPAELAAAIVASVGMDKCLDVRLYKGELPRTPNGKINYFIDARKEK